MAVSPARKIAYDVLKRVEEEAAYASDLLYESLAPNVSERDAALATELTMGVLRWQRLLDFLLEQKLGKSPAQLDLPVLLVLRMGLYQLRFLSRIPARAAVNESVELVKSARKSSAASLVNAVLRRASLDAEIPAETLLSSSLSPIERLAVLRSHPAWMIERWVQRFGEEKTIAILEANNRAPRLTCAPIHSTERGAAVQEFEDAGLHVEKGKLLNSAFTVTGGSITRTKAFQSGKVSIQDEASQAIPLLLNVCEGDRVLDLCAAPGGKTAILARAAAPDGFVVACDVHEHRLKATKARFEQVGLRNTSLAGLDATQPLPFGMGFHRILVDAPCSGTGTLSRNPEIRWRLRPEQLREFHNLQVQILKNAVAQLVSGGKLVYSTCSLEPEENEQVVEEIVDGTPDIRRVPADETAQALRGHLTPGIQAENLFDDSGYFRILPGEYGTDGFFAAVLQKE